MIQSLYLIWQENIILHFTEDHASCYSGKGHFQQIMSTNKCELFMKLLHITTKNICKLHESPGVSLFCPKTICHFVQLSVLPALSFLYNLI